MKENLSFFFNNDTSINKGLINVNIDGGLLQERLFSTTELVEEQIRGRSKPYFLSKEQKPFEFQLAFAFSDDYDDSKLREVSRWLNVDYYKEFYFLDKPEYRFFIMPITDSFITHNGMNQGYITLTMRSNDAYAFSDEILTTEYDLSVNAPTGTKIRLDNEGDIPIGFEMWITKVNDGDITIINTDNDNKEFIIKNLRDTEHVYINHEREDIQSNFPNLYHFDDVLTEYMNLPLGSNVLNIIGECRIQFRYRYKYLIGM